MPKKSDFQFRVIGCRGLTLEYKNVTHAEALAKARRDAPGCEFEITRVRKSGYSVPMGIGAGKVVLTGAGKRIER